MPDFSEHAPGTFCYVELVTTDPEAGGSFYNSLFGWNRSDQDMGEHGIYTQFMLRDKITGAMYKLPPELASQNVPPHWGLYIAVADVDASTRKVAELGGKVVLGPMDVMDAGRMSVLSDPQGATFCLWQAKANSGVQLRDETNTLCWGELMTNDTAAAQDFYSKLLDWSTHTSDTEGMRDYTVYISGSGPTAGMMAITPEMGPIPPNWMSYFQVDDCAKSESRAKELGATILVPTTEIPTMGNFAIVQDPQQAVFGIYQPVKS